MEAKSKAIGEAQDDQHSTDPSTQEESSKQCPPRWHPAVGRAPQTEPIGLDPSTQQLQQAPDRFHESLSVHGSHTVILTKSRSYNIIE